MPTFEDMFLLIVFLAYLPSLTTSSQLYGLIRDKNSPSCSGAPSGCSNLVSINPSNGTITKIGTGHPTLAAVGDLAQIDNTHGIYYFLGDGWNGTGTVLIALDVDTGRQLCATNLNDHIKTVGIVGGEQSLSLLNNTLFVTGLSAASGPHTILVAPLVHDGCPTFQSIGSYPYSGSLPVAHSTTAVDETFRLYTTVSTSAHAYGIDIVDLKTGGLNRTIPMASNTKELWSLTYNDGYLVGPAEDGLGHLDWRTLDIDRGQWTSVPLKYSSNETWNNLWGNLGSIRTYNDKTKELHVLVSQGHSEKIHLATIDVQTGTMNDSTVVELNGDLGYSSEVLLHMVVAG
jgi:hypothetical protein